MKFWDASAIVPLLARQEKTAAMERLLKQDPGMVVWWGAPVECLSALTRLAREGRLAVTDVRAAEHRLEHLRNSWDEVIPGEACRRAAERMLRVHPLRAADSLQLAAALIASDHNPSQLDLVCLDDCITESARKEGFRVWDR